MVSLSQVPSSSDLFVRIVLHVFHHDVQSSISLQKNPLMSYTELCFSLPASRDLWRATSAEAWRDVYLDKRPPLSDTAIPRVSEAMYNTSVLESLEHHIDLELCHTAVLHGFWGQVAAHREAVKFYRNLRSNATQQMWLTSQHQELCRDMDQLSKDICQSSKSPRRLAVLAELCQMVLHVSPDELQLFAGKSGEEEARRTANLFEEWARTAAARHAVWHAGQVFRAARRLPPASLRGFEAIALYFASLALWAYGLLAACPDPVGTSAGTGAAGAAESLPTPPPPLVLVDGRKDRRTKAFLQLDQGTPGLQKSPPSSSPPSVSCSSSSSRRSAAGDESAEPSPPAGAEPLSDPGAVLFIARQLYRDNYPLHSEPLPPLVESLRNLLRDLDPTVWPSRMPSQAASENGT